MFKSQDQKGDQLNAVLDGTDTNGNHSDFPDDNQIKKLANEQEASRKKFDHVLGQPLTHWSSVHDSAVLRDALVSVLYHIRGAEPDAHSVSPLQPHISTTNNGNKDGDNGFADGTVEDDDSTINESANAIRARFNDKTSAYSIAPRAKYIPLRLSSEERKLLRLVEAALNVSEYTDVVDVLSSRVKSKHRIHAQIRDLCSILTGLAVANNYTLGQKLVANRDFADNEEFFQKAFEVARRHKVANPEKSRDTYGKLIHMLQDSVQKDITSMLGFSCIKPMITVKSFLEERDGLALLDDPLVELATREIVSRNVPRSIIQREIHEKERAVAILAKRYRNSKTLSDEDIRRCLYSIGDNNAYLRTAREPCDMMITSLTWYFKPEPPTDRESSLAIASGVGGARLTHDHERQYRYVFQSLALWREVCHEMYKLWYLCETDLLDPNNSYGLRNTGQGLNRVQPAPNVSRAMHEILSTVERRVGQWVGSIVVHLGDYNVPNALTFIDKYAQVQRILGPLDTCLQRLSAVAKSGDGSIGKYIDTTFGGEDAARKLILRDFFRYAFDGSGASDWFSAGSCIDGRLTSAWNWCSEVEKKPYWPLMLLTGFTGFDGDF